MGWSSVRASWNPVFHGGLNIQGGWYPYALYGDLRPLFIPKEPILEFKESIWHVQKGHLTVVTLVEVFLSDRWKFKALNGFKQVFQLHTLLTFMVYCSKTYRDAREQSRRSQHPVVRHCPTLWFFFEILFWSENAKKRVFK